MLPYFSVLFNQSVLNFHQETDEIFQNNMMEHSK